MVVPPYLMTGTLQVDQLGMSMYMLWKLKLYVQPCSAVKEREHQSRGRAGGEGLLMLCMAVFVWP